MLAFFFLEKTSMQAEILPQHSCQIFEFYYLCSILLTTEISPNQLFSSLLLLHPEYTMKVLPILLPLPLMSYPYVGTQTFFR